MPVSSVFDRRGFMVAGAATVASASAHGRARPPFFQRHDLPIGLQLYALGPDAARDLEGALRTVASIGYRTVEMGLMPERPVAAIRKSLDAAGLTCPSVHSPLGDPRGLGGDMAELADRLATIGAKTVVTPFVFLPKRLDQQPAKGEDLYAWLHRVLTQFTADDWKMNADLLNERGRALARSNVKVAYHNHNFEFAAIGDTCGFEILLRNTDPAFVTFEIDIGWVAASGRDPKTLLAAHRGRFTLAHVKDFRADTKANYAMKMASVEVGSGVLDWKTLLPAAYAAGVRQFYVEQEPPFTMPPEESARVSFKYLEGLSA